MKLWSFPTPELTTWTQEDSETLPHNNVASLFLQLLKLVTACTAAVSRFPIARLPCPDSGMVARATVAPNITPLVTWDPGKAFSLLFCCHFGLHSSLTHTEMQLQDKRCRNEHGPLKLRGSPKTRCQKISDVIMQETKRSVYCEFQEPSFSRAPSR